MGKNKQSLSSNKNVPHAIPYGTDGYKESAFSFMVYFQNKYVQICNK